MANDFNRNRARLSDCSLDQSNSFILVRLLFSFLCELLFQGQTKIDRSITGLKLKLACFVCCFPFDKLAYSENRKFRLIRRYDLVQCNIRDPPYSVVCVQ